MMRMMKMRIKDRHEYMKQRDKDAMGRTPRTHQNCKNTTGVCRPGKTAQDKARKAE